MPSLLKSKNGRSTQRQLTVRYLYLVTWRVVIIHQYCVVFEGYGPNHWTKLRVRKQMLKGLGTYNRNPVGCQAGISLSGGRERHVGFPPILCRLPAIAFNSSRRREGPGNQFFWKRTQAIRKQEARRLRTVTSLNPSIQDSVQRFWETVDQMSTYLKLNITSPRVHVLYLCTLFNYCIWHLERCSH